MSTISLRLNNRDDELIKKYAKMKNISVSKLIRDAVIEKIEEELDVELFDRAFTQIKRTYTLDEVKEELGLND
ncbi:MAG TPA: ribbon-helix-helix protein, CopG family [Thermoanaerobacterales bacterium]|jgi:uncharacterized protein (DUF1778 family)|nr:ribbon-helix-helix protein, CopG family [Thermoanaerobacterales bacterium]